MQVRSRRAEETTAVNQPSLPKFPLVAETRFLNEARLSSEQQPLILKENLYSMLSGYRMS